MGYFETVSPESVGIKSQGIIDFLDQCDRFGLELHRMMILRHGKSCAKVIWNPYDENDLHPVYSFSKSLTATAIAFARQEGLLSLDEKLVDLFPDEIPENSSENLKACTIHHLMCMSCGHEVEVDYKDGNWIENFFAHPFVHKPGTFYRYNTTGTTILANIVKRKTGLSVTEYLRPRLFEPLGMGEVFCYCLDDPQKTEHGGGGMKMSLEDMAKFTQFMLQDGCWEGKILLKDWYHKMAGIKQMETAGDSEGHVFDWAYGYGYQCWIGNLPGSFRADGAFGQFGLVYPSLDLCIITNAATEQTQTMMDLINKYILPNVMDHPLEEEGKYFCQRRSLPGLKNCRNPLFEQILSQSSYLLKNGEEMSDIEGLIGGAGLLSMNRREPISAIRFGFDLDHLLLYLKEGEEESILKASLSGDFYENEIHGIRYAATARWRSLRKLELEVRRLDALSGARWILHFEENQLTIETDDTLMTDGGLGMVERVTGSFVQVNDLKNITVAYTGNNPGADRK